MTRRWLIANVFLGAMLILLVVQVVWTWARTLPPVEARAPGKVAEPPPRGAEGGKRSKRGQAEKTPQTPATMVVAIVNKDLFDPSRTKQSEEVKAQAVVHETAPPPGISLVGVRAFGRDREGFILDATQANTQRRIRQGDTVGNFTVKSIRLNSVILVSQAGDMVTLSLAVEKSKNVSPPPVRPGRPQAATNTASASPAAGAAGASPAAGIGATPKPPVTAAGTAAAPQPPIPGTPQAPATPPTTPTPHKRTPSPNLPDSVRQKLEQMKGLNKR